MNLREQKINEIVAQHGLSSEIAGRCVSPDGIVDAEKLGLCLQTWNFAQTQKTASAQAELETLVEQIKTLEAAAKIPGANSPGLVAQMVALKGRLQRLGAGA